MNKKPTLIPLINDALIAVSGKDAFDFLQGQLSCDMQRVTEWQASLAAYCDHKGRVLASLYVCYIQDRYLLRLDCSLATSIMERLNKYIIMADVKLTQLHTPLLGWIAAADNPQSDANLWDCFKPSELSNPAVIQEDTHYILNAIRYSSYGWAIKVAMSPARYIICLLPKYQPPLTASGDHNLSQLWGVCDITDGIAHITDLTSGLFTPHMLNLHKHDTISFTKGCFVGQEIIARTQHLGRLKRGLCLLVFDCDVVKPASAVYNQRGQAVGQIVSSYDNQKLNKSVALAVIHNSAVKPPAPLYLDIKQQLPLNANQL